MTQITLTTTWASLGSGPFDLQVLSGTVVLQAADRRPAAADITGTIVAAIVGAAPTPLAGPGEWWAKALLTGTVVSVTATAAAADTTIANGGAASATSDGSAVAGVTIAPSLVLSLAADGTLQPASASDPTQFGRVVGYALLAAAAGAAVPFTRTDTLTNSAWSLKPGPVFVGENGGITQVEPTVGFVQPAGIAVSATTVVADFGPPTLL